MKFQISDNSDLTISDSEITLRNNWGIHRSGNPKGIRFGIDPIEFYEFRIGYTYKIQILTEADEVLSIPLVSYFGINRSKVSNLQNEILSSLWENRFYEVYTGLVEQYKKQVDLQFDNSYELNSDGLLILKRKELIRFEDMRIDKRFNHYIVNSKSDPKLFTNIYYLKIWNSSILLMILEDTLLSINSKK